MIRHRPIVLKSTLNIRVILDENHTEHEWKQHHGNYIFREQKKRVQGKRIFNSRKIAIQYISVKFSYATEIWNYLKLIAYLTSSYFSDIKLHAPRIFFTLFNLIADHLQYATERDSFVKIQFEGNNHDKGMLSISFKKAHKIAVKVYLW